MVPNDFPDRSVCVLGLGYVGLTLAVTMAGAGFRVWGIEIRDDIVTKLRAGEPHFHEPGLHDRLRNTTKAGALSIDTRLPSECDATVFVITVGTPLSDNHRVRLDMIGHVAGEVAAAMHPGTLVMMRSTVRVGTTRQIVAPILDGAKIPYQLAFCPERTLEGIALSELRQLPQIVGGIDLASTVRAGQLFQHITPTIVRVDGLETAEMIKLIDNAQRDVQFAFANEVAQMCDAIGISAAEVIRAGKLGYARTNVPMPGPVGGPCLEKDPYILAESLEPHGIEPAIVLAARRLNEAQPHHSIAALKSATRAMPGFAERPRIALLGLAFKGRPPTDDLRGTMARPIFAELRAQFPQAEFCCFDPVVSPEAIGAFGLAPVATLEAALAGTDIGVIANNHAVFADMRIETLAATMARPSLIYDFWNNFDARELRLPPGTAYMAVGSHGRARPADVRL